MVLHALVAGLACLAVVGADLRRAPGHPFTIMRTAVAGAWAAVWLTYGVNLAAFPTLAFPAFALLVAACAISLVAIPPPDVREQRAELNGLDRGAGRWAFLVLVGLSAAVVAVDFWQNVPRLVRSGLVDALIQHRTDRANQTGAYGIPGAEMAHALAAVTGVVGYALWVSRRDRLGAVAAVLGFASMLTSTGRWDVVGYALWCFVVDTAVGRRRPDRRVALGAVRLFALLGVFFVAHGELMRKTDHLERLSQMSSEQRLATVNVPVNLGYVETPSPPADDAPATARDRGGKAPRRPAIDDSTLADRPGPAEPAQGAMTPVARPAAAARREPAEGQQGGCTRWTEGAPRVNLRFRELPSIARVAVTYFGGPVAAFDRVVCEDRPGERNVILYWPLKLGRLVGIVAPSTALAVDPFVDIGVPFNNFTVMYSFWSELGVVPGLLAWLATALVLQRFSRWALQRARTVPLVVAGVAPLAIVVRTPWANSFFDGTLAVWIGTALALAALSRRAARTVGR